MNEILGSETRETKSPAVEGYRNIKPEKEMSVKESLEFWDAEFKNEADKAKVESQKEIGQKEFLNDKLAAEKAIIKEESGWSDEIVDKIRSFEEYKIYKDAGLAEAEIEGRKCLVRNDIDWEQKDEMGRTNLERAEQGNSPINKDGNIIEIHHIEQHSDSPFAELTAEEHRGKGNYTILHDTSKDKTEIVRSDFEKEKQDHWLARANEGGNV